VDDGAGIATLQFLTYDLHQGFLMTDMAKPDTGTLSALACGTSLPVFDSSALHAEMKVKAGSPKASLRGTLVFMDQLTDRAFVCQIKAERFSTIPPKLPPGCP
jgi:hypothetical protein